MRYALLPVFAAATALGLATPSWAFEFLPGDIQARDTQSSAPGLAPLPGGVRQGYSYASPGPLPALNFQFRLEADENPDAVSPLGDSNADSRLLSFGLDTRFERRGLAISFGAGVASLNMDRRGNDLRTETSVYPTLSAEIDRAFDLRTDLQVRPFVSAETGVETFVRLGADVSFGGDAPAHTTSTGNLGSLLRQQGFALQLGADLTGVSESPYFDAQSPDTADALRARARAGIFRENARGSQYLGLSVGGEDRADQSALVGAVSIDFNF